MFVVRAMELNSSSVSSISSMGSLPDVPLDRSEHHVLHLSNGAIITLIVMVILTFVSLLGLLGLYFLCPNRRLAFNRRGHATAALAQIHIQDATARRAKAGLELEEIDKLPLLSFQELDSVMQSSRSCAVCLGEFCQGDDKIRLLPRCHHCFHPQCVDVWLRTTASCPLCRCDLHQEHQEQRDNLSTDQQEQYRVPDHFSANQQERYGARHYSSGDADPAASS